METETIKEVFKKEDTRLDIESEREPTHTHLGR